MRKTRTTNPQANPSQQTRKGKNEGKTRIGGSSARKHKNTHRTCKLIYYWYTHGSIGRWVGYRSEKHKPCDVVGPTIENGDNRVTCPDRSFHESFTGLIQAEGCWSTTEDGCKLILEHQKTACAHDAWENVEGSLNMP
jgi:hypothetical protein